MPELTNQEANALLLKEKFGVLSTHSVNVPGYPFGSLVAYCLDAKGRPLIQISALAQHTKNIAQDSRVSLTVVNVEDENIQNAKRVVYLADAKKVEKGDKDALERYYAAFPSARSYGETLDFSFYRLERVALQYIGGLGKIFWIEPRKSNSIHDSSKDTR